MGILKQRLNSFQTRKVSKNEWGWQGLNLRPLLSPLQKTTGTAGIEPTTDHAHIILLPLSHAP